MTKKLHQLSVKEIHQGLEKKEFTVQELLEHLLKRIDKYNPDLNIFPELSDIS